MSVSILEPVKTLPTAPQLSIVVPAFNEEGNLPKLCSELEKVLPALNISYEIIFVDDGSTDGTWDTISSLHEADARVRGIQFSRNFGHQYAIFAGLSNARGRVVICMDADLQHPPAVIPELIEQWRNGSKIVNTVRVDADPLPAFKRVTSRLFYKIFSMLCGVRLQSGMADFRLFDRQALDKILSFGEQGLFLRGIVQWIGFPSSNVMFESPSRFSGSTKYTLRKMLRFSVDGVTSFSIIPLRIGIAIGIITSVIAFWQMGYALYAKIVMDITVPGWATTITVMSFMFGILFILLGLVGEYLGRVLVEVRGRPRFIINEQVGFEPSRDMVLTPFPGPRSHIDSGVQDERAAGTASLL
jgi:polyisoprenyl-phosphate glycosyltransferase